MNHRIVFSTTGMVLYIEAAMMLVPLLIAVGFREYSQALAFLATILVAALGGFFLRLIAPPQRQDIFSKEGFVIVAWRGSRFRWSVRCRSCSAGPSPAMWTPCLRR